MESPQLDHALLCDCATKDYQVCDLCQIVKPAVEQLRARVAELESHMALCREVQSACIEDDCEGPHYLGTDLYRRFTSTFFD